MCWWDHAGPQLNGKALTVYPLSNSFTGYFTQYNRGHIRPDLPIASWYGISEGMVDVAAR